MKIRNGLFLSILSIFLACQQNPTIMSTTTSLDLSDGTGFNANTAYDTFQSTAVGTQTQITFSSADGDVVQFLFNSLTPGKIDYTSIPQITIMFSSLSGLSLAPTAGYVTISSASGTGNSVKAFAGGFQFNLKSTDSTTTTPATTGTIVGSFNYVAPQ